MKMEVDCTWQQKKKKAKVVINFTYTPKNIFLMPQDKILSLQDLAMNSFQMGPPVLKQLQSFIKQYPKSPYAYFAYYKTLDFFEYEEEAEAVFQMMQKKFSNQLFTRCIASGYLIKENKHQDFHDGFEGIEVLKGAFPNRREFFFEEALLFHNLWAK